MFDRFTLESRKIMRVIRDEAANGGYISTTHFLIGLSQADECKKAFELLGLTTAALREESKKYDKKYDLNNKKLSLGVIPFTRRSKDLLEKAVEIAVNQKSNCITPNHLFLGLLGITGTSAQTVIQSLLTLEQRIVVFDKIIEHYKAQGMLHRDLKEDLIADSNGSCAIELEKYQSPFTGEWM